MIPGFNADASLGVLNSGRHSGYTHDFAKRRNQVVLQNIPRTRGVGDDGNGDGDMWDWDWMTDDMSCQSCLDRCARDFDRNGCLEPYVEDPVDCIQVLDRWEAWCRKACNYRYCIGV